MLTLDNTLGAAFLGTVATSVFYGITVIQTYIYFKRNGSDPTYLKLLVFFLWLLDSLHLALVTQAVYFYAVINFSNVLELLIPTWSIIAQILVTGVSDLAVRAVFCQRVWKLSNRNWGLMIAIIISTAVAFGGSIAFTVKGFELTNFEGMAKISPIMYISLGAGVVADVLIAASMCTLLAKRRTGFSRTDSIVRVLILYSINTGALTSLGALLTLITYATMPYNFIFIAFYFVLPKLFLNSLLATLNARLPLRESSSGTMLSMPMSTSNSRLSFSPRSQYTHSQGREDQVNLQIEVRTITDTKTDHEPHENEEEAKSWRPIYSRTDEPIAIAV